MYESININRIIPQTRVEGYGKRYCIWVQGCSIRCKGCFNVEMWDKRGGTEYKVSEIVEDIVRQGEEIEGITILGGEPFEQPVAVLQLVKRCKKLGYGSIVFTGFVYEELLKRKEAKEVLEQIDLLIDGPYEEGRRDFSRPWVGSSNQRYIFLTSRYKKEKLKKIVNKLEIRISRIGQMSINGMGDIGSLFIKERGRK